MNPASAKRLDFFRHLGFYPDFSGRWFTERWG